MRTIQYARTIIGAYAQRMRIVQEQVEVVNVGDIIFFKGWNRPVDEIISAHNYRDHITGQDDWYVEFKSNGRYYYWKQQIDGGHIIKRT